MAIEGQTLIVSTGSVSFPASPSTLSGNSTLWASRSTVARWPGLSVLRRGIFRVTLFFKISVSDNKPCSNGSAERVVVSFAWCIQSILEQLDLIDMQCISQPGKKAWHCRYGRILRVRRHFFGAVQIPMERHPQSRPIVISCLILSWLVCIVSKQRGIDNRSPCFNYRWKEVSRVLLWSLPEESPLFKKVFTGGPIIKDLVRPLRKNYDSRPGGSPVILAPFPAKHKIK